MIYVVGYFLIGFIVAAVRPKSWNAYTAFPATVLLWLPVGLVLALAYTAFLFSKEARK